MAQYQSAARAERMRHNLASVLAMDDESDVAARLNEILPGTDELANIVAENPDRLMEFAVSLDSPTLRDARYPLRFKSYLDRGKTISGDPGVQVEIVKCLLRLDSSASHHAYRSIARHCGPGESAAGSYFFSLLLAALALDSGDDEQTDRWLQHLYSIQTDCPLASRINAALCKKTQGAYGIQSAVCGSSDRICLHPFNTAMSIHYSQSGSYGLRMCDCPGLLPYDLDEDDAWNGPTAQEIRRSIFDGDYSYCSTVSCYHVLNGLLPRKDTITHEYIKDILEKKLTRLPRSPYSVILAHDMSCNLQCPSCRKNAFQANAALRSEHDAFFNKRIVPLMGDNLRWVRLGYTGEAFSSPHILGVIRSLGCHQHNGLKFFTITNGTLLTEKMYASLGPIAASFTHFRVSIDGASDETYNALRYPAKWAKLSANMYFLGNLRERTIIQYLCVTCIVQKMNLDDLKTLYQHCLSWHVDELVFAPLRNWAAFSPEYYHEHNVLLPLHPLRHKALNIIEEIRHDACTRNITIHAPV